MSVSCDISQLHEYLDRAMEITLVLAVFVLWKTHSPFCEFLAVSIVENPKSIYEYLWRRCPAPSEERWHQVTTGH